MRGRQKLIRERTPTPWENNLRFHVENMTPEQLETRATIEENPDVIKVVDRNGNTDSINTDNR